MWLKPGVDIHPTHYVNVVAIDVGFCCPIDGNAAKARSAYSSDHYVNVVAIDVCFGIPIDGNVAEALSYYPTVSSGFCPHV